MIVAILITNFYDLVEQTCSAIPAVGEEIVDLIQEQNTLYSIK